MTDDAPIGLSELLGRRIKAARALRGWTAAEMAARCAETGAPEITVSVIANIESGRKDPSGRRRRRVTVEELEAIARAFGIDPGALTAREPKALEVQA